MNTLLLDALSCKNKSRPPVWLMRQAGRYMPEYRAIREKYTFLEMCQNPEVAAEITLLPIRAFGMDAAILFSDILVIPEALGLGLHISEGEGPILEQRVTNAQDIAALPKVNIDEKLDYVSQAIRLVLPELKVPLIGFCGAPFTVASYMIEGGSSKDLKKTKQWMVRDPESFQTLLSYITKCTIDYLNLQIRSGVHAIQIFDSWANVLGPSHFREFSVRYLKKIIESLDNLEIPVILFCRGSSVFIKELLEINARGISVDWNGDLGSIRKMVTNKIALQGNLDPDILYATNNVIKEEVERMLKGMHGDPGYIFNLGHGIKPDVPVDAVKTLVETVKNYNQKNE